jgi:hypothetical protein
VAFCFGDVVVVVAVSFDSSPSESGLPDFSWYVHDTKTGKNVPNEYKMYKMVIISP